MAKPAVLHTPTRLAIKLRDFACVNGIMTPTIRSVLVTSRYKADGFYVTPDVSVAIDDFAIDLLNTHWTARDLCCVTHAASGYSVPFIRTDEPGGRRTKLPFGLACLYADELALREPAGVVAVGKDGSFRLDRQLVTAASDVAHAKFEQRKYRRAGKVG